MIGEKFAMDFKCVVSTFRHDKDCRNVHSLEASSAEKLD